MLQLHSNQQTMNSREIAQLTGKLHKDVLESIRKILDEVEIDWADFSAEYKDTTGRYLPCFNLPRRECDLVIAGYSAKYRLAIIDRWKELESKQSSELPDFTNPAIAARAWAEQYEARQLAEQKIVSDAPKVEFAMAVRRMEGACHIGDFAKVLGIGRNTFFAMLRKDKILMAGNMPYQSFIDDERFVVIEQTPYTDREGKAHPTFTTMLTGKGQVWIEKKYRGD